VTRAEAEAALAAQRLTELEQVRVRLADLEAAAQKKAVTSGVWASDGEPPARGSTPVGSLACVISGGAGGCGIARRAARLEHFPRRS